MVTPFQAVSTTVPKSVVVAPHRTRSPTLRSRDCSPVIETPSNDESTCNVARPGDSRRIHLLSDFRYTDGCEDRRWRLFPLLIAAASPRSAVVFQADDWPQADGCCEPALARQAALRALESRALPEATGIIAAGLSLLLGPK